MNTLQGDSLKAIQGMRKGLYLIRQNQSEGLVVGNEKNLIKTSVGKGTIDELVECGFIRPSVNDENVFMLTNDGHKYRLF